MLLDYDSTGLANETLILELHLIMFNDNFQQVLLVAC